MTGTTSPTSLSGYLLQLGPRRLGVLVVLALVASVGAAAQVSLTAQMLGNERVELAPVVVVWLATLAALVTVDILMQWVVTGALADIRLDLARRIMGADIRVNERAGNAQLLSILTEDVAAIGAALSSIPAIGTGILIVASTLFYLAIVSPKLAAVQFSVTVVGVLVAGTPLRRGMSELRVAARHRQRLVERFRLVIEGAKELKLDQARRRWNAFEALPKDSIRVRNLSRVGLSLIAVTGGLSRVFAFAVVASTTFVGRRYLGATPSELATFAVATFFLLGPIEGVMARLPSFAPAQAAIDRINQLGIQLQPQRAERETAGGLTTFGTIEMEEVTFSYGDDSHRFTLGPVDFTLRRGQIVFIVGGNGSGKSTFAKLLCGLYQPNTGRVLVDGDAVTDANRDDYRQLWSAVFVDFCIFPEVVSGLRAVDDARALELLRDFGLGGKVTIEDGTFSTVALSTGQRKRLALVSACLRDGDIFLFDEWAADQDPAFRKVFYRKILPDLRARGKTVVAITHDESYFDAADEVVKLEEGRLVQEPTRMFMARLAGTSTHGG